MVSVAATSSVPPAKGAASWAGPKASKPKLGASCEFSTVNTTEVPTIGAPVNEMPGEQRVPPRFGCVLVPGVPSP